MDPLNFIFCRHYIILNITLVELYHYTINITTVSSTIIMLQPLLVEMKIFTEIHIVSLNIYKAKSKYKTLVPLQFIRYPIIFC